jgi:hypothetical protein
VEVASNCRKDALDHSGLGRVAAEEGREQIGEGEVLLGGRGEGESEGEEGLEDGVVELDDFAVPLGEDEGVEGVGGEETAEVVQEGELGEAGLTLVAED